MAIKKTTFEDIKNALWAGANTFRDNIDASMLSLNVFAPAHNAFLISSNVVFLIAISFSSVYRVLQDAFSLG